MNNNPLSNYFRRPSIYISLPSKGKFYKDNLVLEPNNELPIYPMTAIDEITYRTPDALFNGSATADVIKSCVPNIKDPWIMPSIDLSAVLIGIRIASFGHEMNIDTRCPKCQTSNTYTVDLRTILDSLESPDFGEPHVVGKLKIYFRPLNYHEMNENAKINYEEQRLSSQIQSNSDVENDQKIKLLSDAFQKVSKFTIETLAKNIDRIETPESVVSENEYILDFLHNCESNVYKDIKKHIINERSKTDLKPLSIKCAEEECGHEYHQPYTLDMSNFFE